MEKKIKKIKSDINKFYVLIEAATIFKDNGQAVDIDLINMYVSKVLNFYREYIDELMKENDDIPKAVTNNIELSLEQLLEIFFECISDVNYFIELIESGEIEDLPKLPKNVMEV